MRRPASAIQIIPDRPWQIPALTRQEYADLRWHTKQEILTGEFHPVLKQARLLVRVGQDSRGVLLVLMSFCRHQGNGFRKWCPSQETFQTSGLNEPEGIWMLLVFRLFCRLLGSMLKFEVAGERHQQR